MPYADVNEARLFYTDEGSGPVTLLLMHGLTANSHDWSWVIPLLNQKYRIVACDLRGHGSSSVPEGYELRTFADDMVALVEQLGCGPVVPVGHSLGGAIAACMAVEHPSVVQALVEVDPAYGLPDWLVGMWEEMRRQALSSNANGQARPQPAMASPSAPEFLAVWNDRRRQAMPVDVLWKAYDGLARGPEGVFAKTSAAAEYLRRRTCPVLSFHSLPGQAAWETSLFQHPSSRAIEWEGSGHHLQIERPRELATITTSWLDALVGV